MSDETIVLTLEARRHLRLNQRTLGEMLGLSRRTIQRWDSNRAVPAAHDFHRMAKAVHPHDQALAARLAAHGGVTLEQLGLAQAAPPAVESPPVSTPLPTKRSPDLTRHLVDAVVCAAADVQGTAPATVRPVLVSALRKAVDVGLSVEDLLAVLSPPPPATSKPKKGVPPRAPRARRSR